MGSTSIFLSGPSLGNSSRALMILPFSWSTPSPVAAEMKWTVYFLSPIAFNKRNSRSSLDSRTSVISNLLTTTNCFLADISGLNCANSSLIIK